MATVSEIIDVPAPADIQAEWRLLGVIIRSPVLAKSLFLKEWLKPVYFSDQKNADLFETMQAIFSEVDELPQPEKVRDLLIEYGFPVPFLVAVVASGELKPELGLQLLSNVIRYKAALRGIIQVATEMLRDAYSGDLDPREIFSRYSYRLAGLANLARPVKY